MLGWAEEEGYLFRAEEELEVKVSEAAETLEGSHKFVRMGCVGEDGPQEVLANSTGSHQKI